MKTNYLYIVDNYVYYKCRKDETLYKIKFPKSTFKYGKIANIKYFYETLNDYLLEHHLINFFLSEKLICLINNSYTEADKDLLKETLEKMNYNKIKFIREANLLDLHKNAFISLNNDYLLIYYLNKFQQKCYRLIPLNYLNDSVDILNYVNKLIFKQKVYIYGENKNVDDMFEKWDKNKILQLYIIENANTYILNKMFNLKTL